MESKKCGKCGLLKPVSEFHANKNMGASSYCKPCQKGYMRAYYQKNKEKMKAQATEYYKENREKRLSQSKAYNSDPENKRRWKCKDLQRRYGVTLEWYENKLEEQGGLCSICKYSSEDTEGRRLAVDHCHETGEARGLLCSTCNTGLGLLKDSEEVLLAAIAYLQRNSETEHACQ